MKKIFAIIVIGFLCISMLSVLTPKVMGWASSFPSALHKNMAHDALAETGWSDSDIDDIADNAFGGRPIDHLEYYADYYHRVHLYQDKLHEYHGANCECLSQGSYGGAEDGAYQYIQWARGNFSKGIGYYSIARQCLGRAIHFIQDSVCPPHVFPFLEGIVIGTGPHADFELWTALHYGDWQSSVTGAEIEPIGSANDLRSKLKVAADSVYTEFSSLSAGFGYVRQDGVEIGDLSGIFSDLHKWNMPMNGIGRCMEIAASLVKGAAIYVRGSRSGGPDSFGYITYTSSKIPGGLVYDWIEIATNGLGTPILPSSDDSWVGNIDLGTDFFFNYYGTDYSQIAIGNNGLLFSGVGTWEYINQQIKQTPSIHGFIAPYWDDLVTWGSADAIYYQTQGTAPNRKFIVEWNNNQHFYSSSSGITFEAILYEGTNNILFQYKDVDFGSVYGAVGGDNPPYNNGGSATVGIEDPTGADGLQYSFNKQEINPELAILYKFPVTSGINLHLSMNAPASMDRGNTVMYNLYYCNLGRGFFGLLGALGVVMQTTLPSTVDFVSASGDDWTYDTAARSVTWNIGSVPVFPLGRGSRTVTVTIPGSVPVGTVIQTTASIDRLIDFPFETRYDDNIASARTTVTGSSLPPNVGVGPILGNSGGTPMVYWTTPITFTYNAPAATGVDIRIHFDSGGTDITGSMTGGPPLWSYTTTFYPRSGHATVTYSVYYPASDSQVNFGIYVDPAGYIYDAATLERITGASVWLQRPDDQGGWENVPTGQTPPIMQPDVNPQITGADGQYQWDVLAGSYRVHVEAPGYYPADSIVVNIPPPVTDLHVGLTLLPPPPDPVPPTTALTIGDPKYTDPSGNVFVTSDTPFTLTAEDNVDGSGVATTGYRIHNALYDSGWTTSAPPIEFYLAGLADGLYLIDYNSTDNVGNIESTQTDSTTLDNSGPLIMVENPPAGWALQDGVTFIASASDASGIASLNFSIREANGDQGIPVGFEDIPATYDAITGRWNWHFNTLQLPDGYYTVLVNAEDNLGHTASTTVSYSIRNWAVLERLPSTPNSKVGRTMPVKFALRVAASVDPTQPFVYNEELTIKIYATDKPNTILQTSTFGETPRDYRIDIPSEKYITNFKTLSTPKTYRVEIWRKDMLIGSFEFKTTK